MSFGDAYGVFLILMLLTFLGMVAWTYHGKRRHKYEQAANLIFEDDIANKGNSTSEVQS